MDAIRAVASIAVVASHARDLVVRDYDGQLVWSPFYLVTGFGRQAVIVFFVISGFWIGKAVLEGATDQHFWRKYLTNRFSRLYIVLIPALCLGGLLDLLGYSFLDLPIYTQSDAHSLQDVSVSDLTIRNFVGNALFVQLIFVPIFGTNGPLWSLAYEFWFYVWFPAILAIFWRRLSIFALSLGLMLHAPELIPYFIIWLLGVGVYLCNRVLAKPDAFASNQFQKMSVMFAAMGLFTASVLVSTIGETYLTELAVAASFSLLLLSLLRLDRRLWSPPEWLARLGSRSSFSIYIIHFPIIVFVLGMTRAERLPIDAVSATWTGILTVVGVVGGGVFSVFTEAHTKRLQGMINRQFKRREK